MTKCDNKSVGMLIRKDNTILLIQRRKFPFGYAPPAGHIDDFDSPENAAIGEVREEVGLAVENITLISEGQRENPCRRNGGSYHHWWVYEVAISGDVCTNKDEVVQFLWCDMEKIEALAERTRRYSNNEISQDEWKRNPGLELVWYDWFIELGIVAP